MPSLRSSLCALLLLCAVPRVQAQDAPPVNADIILRDLDTIEQQQKATIQSARQVAMTRLKSAAFNAQAAVALYTDAMEAVEFEGKPNKGASFSEWKSTNNDAFRNNEVQEILLLHIKYLLLSLDRGAGTDPNLFVAPALAYAQELVAFGDKFGVGRGQGPAQGGGGGGKGDRDKDAQAAVKLAAELRKSLLDRPVSDGIFAKWLRLGQWLPKNDWELSAGNLNGILEKDIREPLRDQKSAQLIQTWDFEMQVLANRATAGRLDYLAADFNTSVRPQKIYQRANDLIIVGQKNRGISDIYMLVKTYPQHPDFNKWVSRLRELLKSQPAPAVEPAADAATPASETAPQ